MALDFLKKNTSATQRALRDAGIKPGANIDAQKAVSVLLTAAQESAVNAIFTSTKVRLGADDQGKLRLMLSKYIDPVQALDDAHKAEMQKNNAELIAQMRVELAGLQAQAPAAGPSVDIQAILAAQAAQNQLMMQQMMGMVAAAMSGRAPAPAPAAPIAPAATTTTTTTTAPALAPVVAPANVVIEPSDEA
ncbi:MAG: hypothetical protein NT141_01670 [candidate division WWE3 bacterium]|nr:hypothetical protein [candidate division WWE3 bacterium]